MALCQFLPGPASSQVGIALGLLRGGYAGAVAAFLGFTLPSVVLLVVFALGVTHMPSGGDWLHGLKVVAVAVVAQALWGMGRTLTPDKARLTLAIAAATIATLLPSTAGQISAIAIGGIVGWALLRSDAPLPDAALPVRTSRRTGACLLMVFFALLFALPVVAAGSDSYAVKLFAGFYRAGALVFGGGHVILPLLQAQVVPSGWVSNDAFLAGYGAAQAIPGPLTSFAAYLGAVSTQSPSGWCGATLAVTAIFLPAFLLILGALPFWESLRRHAGFRQALLGINAAVVGLLLAAFYHPVWTSAILSGSDFCLAATVFVLLVFWKWPPWLVVALCAALAGVW